MWKYHPAWREVVSEQEMDAFTWGGPKEEGSVTDPAGLLVGHNSNKEGFMSQRFPTAQEVIEKTVKAATATVTPDCLTKVHLLPALQVRFVCAYHL